MEGGEKMKDILCLALVCLVLAAFFSVIGLMVSGITGQAVITGAIMGAVTGFIIEFFRMRRQQ